jgi:signal transduction histidine kinase
MAANSIEHIRFRVDSALLRELGERLVGKPHIALAELVKNSYDADATQVIIRFGKDRIEVIDNGCGMDRQSFEAFWMRIGSPHKVAARLSEKFHRPLTGSKGVGRLAVQFLANELELRTVADAPSSRELLARVNWTEAVQAGELTEAEAQVEQSSPSYEFPNGSVHGTALVLKQLSQRWLVSDVEDLAREIWPLQPPFQDSRQDSPQLQPFTVELQGITQQAAEGFRRTMQAVLDLWDARLTGQLVINDIPNDVGGHAGKVRLSLEFSTGAKQTTTYIIDDCHVHFVDFQIRIFTLRNKQPFGIRVSEAREYVNKYGGVHVYDAGFHLPYYGSDTDWLRIEFDHSHRLSTSRLLPDELNVSHGLNFLPTNSRIFGVVNVDTGRERQLATSEHSANSTQYLQIQVSRDRLVDNDALRDLQRIVRWAIDYYAMQEARRAFKQSDAERDTEPIDKKANRVERVLEDHSDEIPAAVYSSLQAELRSVVRAVETEASTLTRHAGLLGALATAGMSALAYEHEAAKELDNLEAIADRLQSLKIRDATVRQQVSDITAQLRGWAERARGTRDLFSHLLDEENRELQSRFLAKQVLDEVANSSAVLLRQVPVDTAGVDRALRLPKGRFSEWVALFQNVLVNAVNAMLDSDTRQIRIRSESRGQRRAVFVEDTGKGVDLEKSNDLFEPFVRRTSLSSERRSLGIGGTGLGLTIVRMIASQRGCDVRFVSPTEGFCTAFQLSWSER